MARGTSTAALRERRAAVDDPAIVLDAAAAFLAVRPRSVAETRQRLRRLGYRPELIEEVLARLVGLGYLDDAAFGQAWLESRDRARPRGRHVLRRELLLKGLEADLVTRLLTQRDLGSQAAAPGREGAGGRQLGDGPAVGEGPPADLAAAARLLERRRRTLEREVDPRRRRHKAYALLARNGFDPETIGQALDPSADGAEPPAPAV